jgi:hypothetical protein
MGLGAQLGYWLSNDERIKYIGYVPADNITGQPWPTLTIRAPAQVQLWPE